MPVVLALQAAHITRQRRSFAETRDRAGDLQIFSLTLSQLSYRGSCAIKKVQRHWTYADKLEVQFRVESFTSARVA